MSMFKSENDRKKLLKDISEKSKVDNVKVESDEKTNDLSHKYRRQQFIDFGRRIN